MDIVRQIKKTELIKRLKESHRNNFKDICSQSEYISVFNDKYRNWFRGDVMLLHSGWWPDGVNSLIEEYENIWKDEELRTWLR